jgi:hypothetical protein
MEGDVRGTKQCHFTITKERFLPQLLGFALPKNSPHRRLIDNRSVTETRIWNQVTKSIYLRILAVWETGLLDYWNVKVPPIVRKCLKTTESPEKVTLGMRHLSSAFILLIAGYILAIIVFFFENVFGRRRPSVTVL